MALPIVNANVATAMSDIVEHSMHSDPVFIDGFTYSSEYKMSDAGQIEVLKYDGGDDIEVTTPGKPFAKTEDYTNDVIQINLINSLPKSIRVPDYFDVTLPTNPMRDMVWEGTQKLIEARERVMTGILVDQSTVLDDTTELTTANISDKVEDYLVIAKRNHSRPNILMVSPEMEGTIRKTFGKEIIPWTNEQVLINGELYFWKGLLVVSNTWLMQSLKTLDYYKEVSSKIQVDASTTELALYEGKALAFIMAIAGQRIIPDPNSFSKLLQLEIVGGGAVTNNLRSYVKKKVA